MISVIKKFGYLLNKRQKRNIGILFAMMLVGAVLEVCGVSMMLPLMTAFMQEDIIDTNPIVGWICGAIGIQSHRTFVVVCVFAMIAIFILKNLYLTLQYYAQSRFIANSRFMSQSRLLATLLNRPYEYFLDSSSGEIVRMVQEDTNQTFGLLSNLLFFFTETIVAVAVIITIFVIDPIMTAGVAIMLFICVAIISKVVKPAMNKEGRSRQKHIALSNKWLLQSISGIKELKVTHREEFFLKSFEYSGAKVAQSERRRSIYDNVPRLFIEAVCVCSMLLVIGIMVINGRDMQSLIPAMGAFAMAALKILPSANRITTTFSGVAFAGPALDKIIENTKRIEDGGSKYEFTSKIQNKGIITLNNEVKLDHITYEYPNTESPVINDATMIIPVGKSVGVVGTSGAGKTTAIDIMLGLLNPSKGHILADGMDIMEDYAGWLSHLGYIPQTIFMLDDTIRANVAFGMGENEVEDEKVWHALAEAQLEDFVRGLPEGLDTSIGERGIRLSGGQRQRIGIARALYTDPELLVFDEATSSLDNETEAAIMESINSLHGKKTLVIIAHRLQTIEKCDMVYRVHDGKIERER